tara:strand:+ start:1597 stop:2274 length:678 start_codon:yes stop_codon:yes gene_type:complete
MSDHFDLSGARAVIVGADQPAGTALREGLSRAGAVCAAAEGADTRSAVRAAAESLGGLDVLGVGTDVFHAAPLGETLPAAADTVMAANYGVAFAALQAATELMQAQGTGGRIVLTTSVLGERGVAHSAAYSAAQGAIVNLVRAAAQELAPDGITVNGVELGWMDWMSDRIDPTDENALRAVRFTMLKRAGTQADVEPLVVWLAGSGAGFVTGQIFPLDGGLSQHL